MAPCPAPYQKRGESKSLKNSKPRRNLKEDAVLQHNFLTTFFSFKYSSRSKRAPLHNSGRRQPLSARARQPGLFEIRHLACSERAGAVFLTTDDFLIRVIKKNADKITIEVANPVPWLMEVTN